MLLVLMVPRLFLGTDLPFGDLKHCCFFASSGFGSKGTRKTNICGPILPHFGELHLLLLRGFCLRCVRRPAAGLLCRFFWLQELCADFQRLYQQIPGLLSDLRERSNGYFGLQESCPFFYSQTPLATATDIHLKPFRSWCVPRE